MSEFEESQDKTRISGGSSAQQRSGTVIASLLRELRSLRQRSKELEAALEVAKKKVAFYELYDAKLQGALTTALKVAFEIKADAEEAASAIIEGAVREKEAMLKEVEALKEKYEARLKKAQVLEEAAYAAEEGAVAPARAEAIEVRAPTEPETPEPVLEAVASLEKTIEIEGVIEVAEAVQEPSGEVLAPTAQGPEESSVVAVGEEMTQPLAPPHSEENHNRVELVISSLPSFLRLVDFQRSLTHISAIKNFYVRDFRRGVVKIELKLLSASEWPRLIEGLNHISGLKIGIIEEEARRIEGRLEAA